MEAQKPKIALYVQRSFGEKLTATFDFIKENWKPLMKFTTYLMLPLCLLQGLSLNGLMSGTMALGDMTGGSFDSSVVGASIMALVTYYSLYAVLYLLGTVMLTSLVYALVRTYNEREERLQGVTMIPWYIGTIVKYIFAMTDAGGGATVSAAYSFVLYLLAVVQAFGVYMSMIFSLLGLAYQYGHASEKIDYVMVESDIDNFDKL